MSENPDWRMKIIEELSVLQKKEQQDRNVFKARAYGKVIQQLGMLDRPITKLEDLDGIEGVGEKIRAKISEILQTGFLHQVKEIQEDAQTNTVEMYMNMYGVGPVKAKSLAQKYPGVHTIDEFRRVVDENPKVVNDKQRIGLKYYEDLLERIPRAEMLQHNTKIRKVLQKIGKKTYMCDLVGSFRRGGETSGDIDVLIGYPSHVPQEEAERTFKRYVEELQANGYITDILALGPKKCMAICRMDETRKARRLDLLLTNATEYPYAMLYFTGSDKFNIQFRKRALERGYTLNEHEMKPIRDGVPEVGFLKDEQAIFAFLDIPYVEPEKRGTFPKL